MQKWEELNTKRYYQYINNIKELRGQWNVPDGEYWEGHHIIPRSFNGEGDTKSKHDNIIWLYAYEHFEAHKILAEDNASCKEIIWAYWRMAQSCDNKFISSKEYAIARELFVKNVARKKKSAETRDKMKKPKSELHRQHIGDAIKKRAEDPNDPIHNSTSGSWKKGDHSSPVTEFKKGNIPWNKGLTKDTDDRVAQYSMKGSISKRKPWSNKRRVAGNKALQKKVMCIETGIIYDSVRGAAKITGCKNITRSCKNNKYSSKGFHWKYV